uniref:NADH-ubiquinone oxidoreductase chain 1 n=1 Tax=Pelecinus polyturator TaxID=44352 RepID=A0A0E3EKX8_9HYME|nr:NADH dehydrogenase subunit 1 [Pelecinus polyturator]AIW82477.1 NADH dehydrogenase subunit 1 [Pelecinus polyturator]
MYFMNSLIIVILNLLMVLLSVAFLTLFERKLLGLIQLRKGPEKVSFLGMMQPFSDAMKLLLKEMFFLMKSMNLYYLLSPIFMFTLMLFMWLVCPFYYNLYFMSMGVMIFFVCLSMGVYSLVISSWASNSMYSLLGSMRSIIQTISYEISIIMMMFMMIMLVESFNFIDYMFMQINLWFMIYLFFISMFFYIMLIMELNRTPFDFSEGESELVSGFNIEYMSSLFVLIFLSEYGMIIFMMMIYEMMFMGGKIYLFSFYLILMFLVMMIILIRGSMPRYRIDKMLMFIWLSIFPYLLILIIMFISMKGVMMYYLY